MKNLEMKSVTSKKFIFKNNNGLANECELRLSISSKCNADNEKQEFSISTLLTVSDTDNEEDAGFYAQLELAGLFALHNTDYEVRTLTEEAMSEMYPHIRAIFSTALAALGVSGLSFPSTLPQPQP